MNYVGRIAVFFCAVFFVAHPVLAATLYMEVDQVTLGRGDAAIAQVRLDTDEEAEECVNAVSGVLDFTGPIEPIDVSTGQSIFSLWVQPPTIIDGKVEFAGGIPNGYCGRIAGDPRVTNELFSVIVRADSAPGTDGTETAIVAFTEQTETYLNDGLGTRASLRTLPAELSILPTVGSAVRDPWSDLVEADVLPPEPFSIRLERDERAFSGRYYVSFNTTDKQTGIDHYEVYEEPVSQFAALNWGRATTPWVEARSPYVLKDQSLNSVIRVKAIDKAGNEYVAHLLPDSELRSLSVSHIILLAVLFGSVLLVVILLFVVMRTAINKRREKEFASYMTDTTTAEVTETRRTPDWSPSNHETHSSDTYDSSD